MRFDRGNTSFVLVAALLLQWAVALPAIAADSPLRQIIDEQVRAAWQKQKIQPATPSEDGEFLRRIYLDLTGVIPTYEQARAFLDDASADKRSKLIDQLLGDPLYARHQADVWDQILVGRNPPEDRVRKREGFQRFLREQFEKNTPYDKLVGQLLRAEGNTVDDGAPVYLVQFERKAEDAIESVTQTFLGVQLQCARCHDHPYEPWTQVDFYGMAAFLTRLELVTVGKDGQQSKLAMGEKNSGELNFTPAKQQLPGKKGMPIAPKFLAATQPVGEPELPKDFKEAKFPENQPPVKPQFSRREKLIEWIVARDNPYFARAAVNRIWAQFMGRGFIHPVDDMKKSDKPSHPALLDAMAMQFAAHDFDMKWLIREIVSSQAYQLSGTGSVKDAAPLWYERARVRPLSAEEMLESWRIATGYDDAIAKTGKDKDAAKNRFHGVGWDYVVRFFGSSVTGEGDFQGGLQEHLYLNNGELGRLITSEKGGLIDAIAQSQDTMEAKIDRLFVSLLSRLPREEERTKFAEYLAGDEKKNERLKEAIWAMMTCSEFRFNH